MLLLGVLQAQAAGAVAAGSFDLLETQVLASNQASVTFSSLSTYAADYQHLQIRLVASASTSANVVLTMNGVTTSSYSRHQLFGNGSTVGSGGDASTIEIYTAILNSSTFNAGVIDILDPFETSKNKTVRTLASGDLSGTNFILLRSGAYLSTNAITSLTLTPSGNFLTGSRFSLYGIKAA